MEQQKMFVINETTSKVNLIKQKDCEFHFYCVQKVYFFSSIQLNDNVPRMFYELYTCA